MNISDINRTVLKLKDRVRKFGQLITTQSDLNSFVQLIAFLSDAVSELIELQPRVKELESQVKELESELKKIKSEKQQPGWGPSPRYKKN